MIELSVPFPGKDVLSILFSYRLPIIHTDIVVAKATKKHLKPKLSMFFLVGEAGLEPARPQ